MNLPDFDPRFYTPTANLRMARVVRPTAETHDAVAFIVSDGGQIKFRDKQEMGAPLNPAFLSLDGHSYRLEQQWTHNFHDKPAVWLPVPVEINP